MIGNAKVLIIDDDAAVGRLVCRVLEREGYLCQYESDVETVMARLQSERYDLVIIDVIMPGIGGIELLKQIKMQYPYLAAIMLSGITEVGTATQCLKLGATDYLVKPVDFRSLSVSVRRALEKQSLFIQRRDLQIFLEQEVDRKTQEIQQLFFSTILALVSSLDAKDSYTENHSRRVTLYSLLIGKEMKISPHDTEQLRLAGILHDIGKIGISEAILNKPGKLTVDEFHVIERHSEIGESILRFIPQLSEVRRAIRHHHERFDGNGYPDRMRGESIPFISRILMVADAFDAMTSDRPYRKALNPSDARAEIIRCRERQFDPDTTDAFAKLDLLNSDVQHIMGSSHDDREWAHLLMNGNPV